MARGTPSEFGFFGGGLNTADGPYRLIEPYFYRHKWWGGESRGLLNVVSRHRGNVSKRNGCLRLVNDATRTYKDLSIVGNGSSSFAVCSSTAGGMVAIASNYAVTQLLAAASVSTTAPWTFLRMPVIGAQGPAYGMNGTDTPRRTDGTLAGTGTWTAVSGTLPNGTLMAYHDNTLWVAGVAATPYSIFWSSLGDPTGWPAANVTKFNPDDGLPITALRSTGSYLLVFKERGIWSVYNSETSANRKFTDNIGTISPRSVVATPEGTFFLDPQFGVHITDGSTVRRIGESIQPTLDQITDPDLANVTAAYVNGHYYMSAKVSGVQLILDYDTELNSWWIHSPTVAQLATWDRGADPDLMGLVTGTGDIWHMFKDGEIRDNGTIFESYWSGPFHAFGAPNLRKRVNEVHIDARGKMDVYVATDYAAFNGALEASGVNFSPNDKLFGGAGTFGGLQGTFGGGGQIGEGWLYTLGVARSWSFTFYNATDDHFEVDGYTINASPRKD
ncbi:MAG: hypothetical protein JWO74_2307 [Solirubrobacterales bacterium]|nr:hypothetical protein [Solirubrobacterales bacterium]